MTAIDTSAAPRRGRRVLAGVAGCLLAAVGATPAIAAGKAEPAPITELDVEVAGVGLLALNLRHISSDEVSEPCPVLTPEQLGWYLGQHGFTSDLTSFSVNTFYDDEIGSGVPGVDCSVDLDRFDNPDPAAPHYPAVSAAYLSEDTTFADYLTVLDGSTVLTPDVAGIGGEIGGRCVGQRGQPRMCWLSWHKGSLVVDLMIAGGDGDVTRAKSKAMLTAMVPDVIANLKQAAALDDEPDQTTTSAPTTASQPTSTEPVPVSTTVPEPPSTSAPSASSSTTTSLPQVSLPPPTTAPDRKD